jgi:putative hydrolase of the HAD superfamily
MPYPIQVLTVDAAGTLVQPWPSVGAVYGKTARDHGISVKDEEVNEQFLTVFATIQKNKKISQGEEKDFWREVVSKVFEPFADGQDIDPIFEILWNLFAEGKHWRVAQNAESTLLTLKQRGYKLAVLSNNDSRLRSVLEDHKIGSLFDHLFISSELGVEKPAQAIFQAVEKKFNLPPSSFMHLGDSHSRDFAGAKSAGWSALLYGKPVIEKEQIVSFPELLEYLP